MHKSIFVLYLGCGWCLFGIQGHVAKKKLKSLKFQFFSTEKLKFQKKKKITEISVKLSQISFFR